MKKLILLLVGAAFIASYALADGNTPQLTLHKTTKAVVPDGLLDGAEPWTTTWINIAAAKSTNSTSGMSAKFQLAYTDKYFWVLCTQLNNADIDTDRTLTPNSYERDCFEVFIDPDTTSYAHTGTYGVYNNQFRMVRACEYPIGFDDAHNVFTNAKGATEDTIGQVDNGDGSFVQEWQVTWKSLLAPLVDSGTFAAMQYIKFEIQAADNTTNSGGGRTQQMYWKNNSDLEWNDSRTHSVIFLADKVDTATLAVNTLKNINQVNVWVVNDMLKLSKTANVNIYSLDGRLLLTAIKANQVNISRLPSGIYVAKTSLGTTKFVKR